MTKLTMPRLSDSMEEGTILTWLKGEGDDVAVNDEIVEIETDKATMTHTAEAAGVLHILAAEGETLAVGAPIATVADVTPAASASTAGVGGDPEALEPSAVAAATDQAPEPASSSPVPAAIPIDSGETASAVSGSSPSPGPPDSPVLATPLARRVAKAHDLDLEQITGSGPRGRITKADVAAAADGAKPGMAVPEATTGEASEGLPGGFARPASERAQGELTRQGLSRRQEIIARRMAEAKATIPHFQVETEVRMDAALDLRRQLKGITACRPVPSINDLIVKAAAIALREHPKANGSYANGHFDLHGRVNVGVAVAGEEGLVVPTVFDADMKTLGQIARETLRLIERVRTGHIEPPDLAGGTFTVSNLGMFGMTAITPVINPPQAAILGVGAARPVLERVEGEIRDLTLVTLRLSCDHRILYGADAARFLAKIGDVLETPLELTL